MARFSNAGYAVTVTTLNAKDLGIPQSRERVFFIGFKQGVKPINTASFRKYQATPPTLREVLSPLGKVVRLTPMVGRVPYRLVWEGIERRLLMKPIYSMLLNRGLRTITAI